MAAASASLLLTGCGHHAAPPIQTLTSHTATPNGAPNSTAATPSGWDLGTAIPHGETQSYEGLPKAWTPESMSFPVDFNGSQISTLFVSAQGANSPWLGFVKSSGYWEVVYHWQGRGMPPKTKYGVNLRTDVLTNVKGDSLSFARATEHLDKYPEKYVPMSLASSYSGDPTVVPVEHDASGYFLRVSTRPVFGEVKQAEFSAPWEGSVVATVKYGPPKPI